MVWWTEFVRLGAQKYGEHKSFIKRQEKASELLRSSGPTQPAIAAVELEIGGLENQLRDVRLSGQAPLTTPRSKYLKYMSARR